jgi:hypothetical protein
MASTQEVRQYLAHWFQLGKVVQVPNSNSIFTQPEAYLDGTEQTIAELLTDRWDVIDCARCTMPIPLPAVGLPQNSNCTCQDIPTWPNTELPMPRSLSTVETKTNDLRQRLAKLALSPPQPPRPSKTD